MSDLRTFLGDMDWSPDDFARLTGIHRTTVYRWLAGDFPVPAYIYLIMRLCRGINRRKLWRLQRDAGILPLHERDGHRRRRVYRQ